MASLLMVLTAIGGLALPACGDDWRPFSGHADEMLTTSAGTGAEECVEGGCRVTATGAGQATYLGSFTRQACGIRNPDGSVEGTVEFTTANGDILCAEVKGGPPDPDNTVRGTYTFTGGTGRFIDASGGAYFVGVITSDSAGTHIAIDFGGIIQY
jgi:hypothetical protein